ncbi:hypothetical protein BGX28_000897 [Mortierella sp. GBA30]|nr:hypothetical protein BGX28_000897 [Mortierella sp. GBA30]
MAPEHQLYDLKQPFNAWPVEIEPQFPDTTIESQDAVSETVAIDAADGDIADNPQPDDFNDPDGDTNATDVVMQQAVPSDWYTILRNNEQVLQEAIERLLEGGVPNDSLQETITKLQETQTDIRRMLRTL